MLSICLETDDSGLDEFKIYGTKLIELNLVISSSKLSIVVVSSFVRIVQTIKLDRKERATET